MKYPAWWDRNVTVYNKRTDAETHIVTWQKTAVDGCFVKNANNKIKVGTAVIETNNIIVRIPQRDKFITPAIWRGMTAEETGGCFTLQPGDIIVMGAADDEIDEYTKGARSSDLISKYKERGECLVISKWQDNTGTGRIFPHYFVSGE